MNMHFKKRKDKKVFYLPFHDTWNKRVLITEVYTEPEFTVFSNPIWDLSTNTYETKETISTMLMYMDIGYSRRFNIVYGINGIYGRYSSSGTFEMFSRRARVFRGYSLWNDSDYNLDDYCVCEEEEENELSIYNLKDISDISITFVCDCFNVPEKERSRSP